ncbi:MAG: holo-ACP synthase [Endomicrobium sp.]|jgi:holo-[acyl-carrier protein] synthase|nr:holo-ACP synthase [Endomicrobium sp.]
MLKNKDIQDMNIGADIEEVKRFKKYAKDKERLERLFSKDEIFYCLSKKNPAQSLAARFCAKEAVWKALEKENKKITVADISVKNNSDGTPEIYVKNKKRKDVKVSLSHTKEYAMAMAVKL